MKAFIIFVLMSFTLGHYSDYLPLRDGLFTLTDETFDMVLEDYDFLVVLFTKLHDCLDCSS